MFAGRWLEWVSLIFQSFSQSSLPLGQNQLYTAFPRATALKIEQNFKENITKH